MTTRNFSSHFDGETLDDWGRTQITGGLVKWCQPLHPLDDPGLNNPTTQWSYKWAWRVDRLATPATPWLTEASIGLE